MFRTRFNRRQILLGLPSLALAGSAVARAPTTGIIFAGASWCPACKQAAPVLAAFAERHGLPVIVASADERPIPPFPEIVPLNHHPMGESVSVYPTTLIYNAARDAVIGSVEGYRNSTWYLSAITTFVRQSEEISG